MRRFLLLLLTLVFAGAAPAAAQTPEERARLDWVERRGRLLFEIDRAAWVTTDDLRRLVPDLGAAGIRGWTVEPEGGGYIVTYFTGEGDARATAYRARVENNQVVRSELIPADSRPPLTALQRRLADGRRIAFQAPLRACARSGLNAAVIAPETPEGPMDIYVLTPQTQSGIYPAGGHNRVSASAAGEILSHRAFTNSCINLGGERPPPGAQASGLLITHLLDSIPTEVHVFLQIWIGMPLGVAAGGRAWMIRDGQIRQISNSPSQN